MNTTQNEPSRIVSLDQFRGYTVAGMMLVNFLGSYAIAHDVFKHHKTWCSYADTIMPQFFFAVGFAYRLTFLKRLARHGTGTAVRHTLGRVAGLIVIGALIYQFNGGAGSWAELQAGWGWAMVAHALHSSIFQTLVHIGITSLWVLPVIAARPAVRVAFAAISGLLHLGLAGWFYHKWAWSNGAIDGGPLGFLTWSIPLLAGSLAYDALLAKDGRRSAPKPLLGWGAALMLAGYALSCLSARAHGQWLAAPPFAPPVHPVDLWTMSQKTGSLSYQIFCTGLSLVIYAIFVVLCDRINWRLPLAATLGQNALAVYIIHSMVKDTIRPFIPKDAPLWYVMAGFAVFFFVTWLFVWRMDKNGIHLKL